MWACSANRYGSPVGRLFNNIMEHSRLSKRSQKKIGKFKRLRKLHKQDGKSSQKAIAEVGEIGPDIKPQTEYYFENGLRKVYPYYYSFSCYIKGRWMKRTILDVFVKEFRSDTPENYKRALEQGTVTVNGKAVPPDFILGENQLLAHTCHRHENPVLASPIEIVADTKDVLVINKPCSIPCHPCGRYRYNTVLFILGLEYGYWNLRNLHRLDRLTSGVLIMTKNAESATKLEKQLRDQRLEKTYVCRVVGKFPDGPLECNEPLAVMSHKLSLSKVSPGGKASKTTFRRLSYNGKTSVVECIPKTGRTHQIRVHLQFLGYPIVNDPFYNSPAFGPGRGKGGVYGRSEQEVIDEIMKHHNVGLWVCGDNPLYHRKVEELKRAEGQVGNSENIASGSAADSTPLHTCTSGDEVSKNLVDPTQTTVTNSGEPLQSNGDCKVPQDLKDKAPPQDLGDSPVNPTSDTSVADVGTKPFQAETNSCKQADQIQGEEQTDSKQEDLTVAVTGNKTAMDSSNNCDQEGDAAHSEADEIGVPDGPSVKRLKIEHTGSDISVTRFDKNSRPTFDETKHAIDVKCDDCRLNYIDPKIKDMEMYLHALKYKGPDWEYETLMPDWASEDWQDPD